MSEGIKTGSVCGISLKKKNRLAVCNSYQVPRLRRMLRHAISGFGSVQSLGRLDRREDIRFSRDPLPVLSARGHGNQFWHRQGCSLFDVGHPAFPLPTTASPTLQDSLKGWVRGAVLAPERLSLAPSLTVHPWIASLPCGHK